MRYSRCAVHPMSQDPQSCVQSRCERPLACLERGLLFRTDGVEVCGVIFSHFFARPMMGLVEIDRGSTNCRTLFVLSVRAPGFRANRGWSEMLAAGFLMICNGPCKDTKPAKFKRPIQMGLPGMSARECAFACPLELVGWMLDGRIRLRS